jgi:hypothetical protein
METPELMAAAYRTEMQRLLDAIERIPAERLDGPVIGEWTIADVLVHLAGWDQAIAASSDDVLAGRPARLVEMRLEDINEDLVAARRGRPLAEARRELAEAHQGLLDRVAAIPAERWHSAPPGLRWSDGSEMTVASVFAYRYRGFTHYGGHAAEIEEWLRELSR